jgi:beta-mannanase
MKKTVFYLIVLGGVFLLGTYVVKHKDYLNNLLGIRYINTIQINPLEPILAVFSFHPEANNKILDSFIHYTLKLTDTDDWDIKREEIAQIPDSIPLVITVETWGRNFISSAINNPIDDMMNGKFNYVIEQLCTQLIGIRPNVYFRFNPEMEVPINRYPWQQKGGSAYIEAFRHFAMLCKTSAPQVKQIWGPAGYPGADEFYPGDDVVDAVSVTINSDSEMQLNVYPKDYPVTYNLYRRLHRLRFIDKPVFVLGSNQIVHDSINEILVNSITNKIIREKDIIYSKDNFKRPYSKSEYNRQRKIEIGLFDPQSLLSKEDPVTVEHIFADFDNLNDGTFERKFNKVVDRGHDIIITIEPYFSYSNLKSDLHVLQHVTEGKYDQEIAKLYAVIMSTDRRVYLRYAHEMEIPVTRYQWQSQDPVDYIKSYRYFMTFEDTLPATIKRVWGPAGDRGSLEWWPGNDVVDFISIAIYGLPDKNITDPEKQESFSTIFKRKYWRLRFVDKPIFITEFGVKGSEEYQTKWLEAAAKVIRNNPQVKGINYFNMSDTPLAWGEIKPPDWSITKKSFYRFLKVLEEN